MLNLEPPSRRQQVGFTLLELMIAIAVASLLASFAIPAFNDYINDARTTKTVGDMGRIMLEIEKFRSRNNDELPGSLAELGIDGLSDPWTNAYAYLDITKETGKGNLRKDKNLNPLNSDYDLYSKGADGDSKKPLQPKVSHDDIIRANNGAYIGLAKDY